MEMRTLLGAGLSNKVAAAHFGTSLRIVSRWQRETERSAREPQARKVNP